MLRLAVLSLLVSLAACQLDCYENTYEPTGSCLGYKVTTKLCEDSQTVAAATTNNFGLFIVGQLDAKAKCSALWNARCVAVGGTRAVDDKACPYSCGLLQSASTQCSGPGTCTEKTPVPNPIPNLKDVVDLSMSLTCCDWIKNALMDMCDTHDMATLNSYVEGLKTSQVPFTGSGIINQLCEPDTSKCISPNTTPNSNCPDLLCGAHTHGPLLALTAFAALVAALRNTF